MTAIVQVGPRSEAQVGYDLLAEDRAHAWEDWRHDLSVVVRPEALAAETWPAVPQETETARIFRASADLIERRGWWSGGQPAHQGLICAFEALDVTVRKTEDFMGAYNTFLHYLNAQADRHFAEISFWNDYPGRTKEQVLAALRECADLLDERADLLRSGPSAVDRWQDEAVDSRHGWWVDRLAELDAALGGKAAE
jgi:hypothetical protein